MLADGLQGPQCTARLKVINTGFHPEIPYLDAFIERTAEGDLTLEGMSSHAGDWLLMAVVARNYFLTNYVEHFQSAVIRPRKELAGILAE